MVNMSAVWDRAIEFVSDHVGPLLPIALLAIMIPLSLNGSLAPLSAAAGPGLRIGLGAASVALLMITLWGRLAVTALAIETDLGAGGAARRATRRLLPTIGISLLMLGAALVLALPVFAVMAAYGYDFAAAMRGDTIDSSPAAGAWSALYLIVLVPFLAWIAARLALTSSVIVAEGVWLAALRRSFVLTRGLAMKIIGVAILYGVLVMVVALAARFGFGTVLRLATGGSGAMSAASIITATILAAINTLFAVIATSFLAKLYVAARTREAAQHDEAARLRVADPE